VPAYIKKGKAPKYKSFTLKIYALRFTVWVSAFHLKFTYLPLFDRLKFFLEKEMFSFLKKSSSPY